MFFNLKNKVILITGASAGIGLEIAKECLSLDAKVMLHSSPDSFLKIKDLIKSLGKNASCVDGDLSDFSNLKKIVDKTIDIFGTIDGLVNNAGIFPRNNISNIDENSYQQIMDVNFKAPLFLSKYVINYFLKNQIKGCIVNIGSINAYCGQDDLLIYSTSKGALMTLTRNLADYLSKSEIRVNQLNVGWTFTEKEHQTQLNQGREKKWFENVNPNFAPRGILLQADEVAKHACFWLSDYSKPVTGSVYEVEQYPLIGRNKINA